MVHRLKLINSLSNTLGDLSKLLLAITENDNCFLIVLGNQTRQLLLRYADRQRLHEMNLAWHGRTGKRRD